VSHRNVTYVFSYITRTTSQSPCLHETLATVAITWETRRACFS